jgi:hypothetical protein
MTDPRPYMEEINTLADRGFKYLEIAESVNVASLKVGKYHVVRSNLRACFEAMVKFTEKGT